MFQTKEVVDLVKSSTADFAIVGGDFNIDPRMTNETTYQTLTAELKNSMHEFFYYIEVIPIQPPTYTCQSMLQIRNYFLGGSLSNLPGICGSGSSSDTDAETDLFQIRQYF